jgi:hypothetical protein
MEERGEEDDDSLRRERLKKLGIIPSLKKFSKTSLIVPSTRGGKEIV